MMVLFSANGVLPGNSATRTGATGTYNPFSMTCSNCCGLDGSGCGSQDNSLDLTIICSFLPVGPIVPTPTLPTPITNTDKKKIANGYAKTKQKRNKKCDYSGVCVKHTVRHTMDVNNQSILSYDIFKRKMYGNYLMLLPFLTIKRYFKKLIAIYF